VGTPDVRVRLSAEGVAEIIAALDAVKRKTESTGKSAAGSFNGFAASLSSVKGLLGTIGVATSLAGFVALGKSAAQAAENMGVLAQRLGTSAQNIQALQLSAKLANVDFEASSRSIAKFLVNTTKAAAGAGAAAKPLTALGFSMKEIKDLAGKDLATRLDSVAQKFKAFPDGPNKSAAALELFGTRGLALIPLLDQLGTQGIDATKEKLAGLGALLDDQVINTINAMNDQMDVLLFQFQALAAQAAGGFAPGFTAGIKAMSQELSQGTQGWRLFGEMVGQVLGFITVSLTTMADSLHTRLTTLSANIVSLFRAAGAAMRGNFEEAQVHIESIGLRREREEKLLAERVNRAWGTFFNQQEANVKKLAQGEDEVDLDALYQDKFEAQRSKIEGELALVRALAKAREQAEQRSYDQAITDVTTYYDKRRRIVKEATDAEFALLDKRREIEAQNPDTAKAEAAVAKTAADREKLKLEAMQETAALFEQERKEVRSLADERLALDRRIFEAKGEQHRAALIQIEQEVRKASELLSKAGPLAGNEADRAKKLAELREALTTEAELNDLSRQATIEMADLGRERARIEGLASAGLISQVEAQRQLRELELGRIDVLRQLADQMLAVAQASGAPENIAKAQEFSAALDGIERSAAASTLNVAKLGAAFEDAAVQGLDEFFSTGIQGSESFAQAINAMASQVISSLQRIIAQMLAVQLVGGILGLFAGGGKTPNLGAPTLPKFPTTPIPAHATGGLLGGVGGPTADANLGLFSPGEFLVRSATTMQPGALSFLHEFNKVGMNALRSPVRRYADGGVVGPAGASGSINGQVTVGLGEGLVLNELDTPDGDKLIVKMATRNRRALNRILGG
jgi:hypothetical protein